MPDDTYPNPKIIYCILGCIDRLPITKDELEGNDLEKAINMYKENAAGPGYGNC